MLHYQHKLSIFIKVPSTQKQLECKHIEHSIFGTISQENNYYIMTYFFITGYTKGQS